MHPPCTHEVMTEKHEIAGGIELYGVPGQVRTANLPRRRAKLPRLKGERVAQDYQQAVAWFRKTEAIQKRCLPSLRVTTAVRCSIYHLFELGD